MKIILVGGGTLGSVTPLIAIAEKIKKEDVRADLVWVGTTNGPEKELVISANIPFKSIPSGKLRRYFSIQNIIDLFLIFLGILASYRLLIQEKPNLIIGSGSYVQVPLMLATRVVSRKTKIIMHVQDVHKGLAHRLTEKCADTITLSVEESAKFFPEEKTVLTGNPYREEIHDGSVHEAQKIFNLDPTVPTVLILGGGTGSTQMNTLVKDTYQKLTLVCNIIHITGKGKEEDIPHTENKRRFFVTPFLTDELKHAYAAADIVVSRAGFSTLTELTFLAKPVILIPLAGTHQEDNATLFVKKHAAIALDGSSVTPAEFTRTIRALLKNNQKKFSLSAHMSSIMPNEPNDLFLAAIRKTLDKDINVKKWN